MIQWLAPIFIFVLYDEPVFRPGFDAEVVERHVAECVYKRACKSDIGDEWNVEVDGRTPYSVSFVKFTGRKVLLMI